LLGKGFVIGFYNRPARNMTIPWHWTRQEFPILLKSHNNKNTLSTVLFPLHFCITQGILSG